MMPPERLGTQLIRFAILALVGCGTVESEWDNARKGDAVGDYEYFLNRNPKNQFSDEARARILELRRAAATRLAAEQDDKYHKTKASKNLDDYRRYLGRYPRSPYTPKVLEAYEELLWAATEANDISIGYEAYLEEFPNGKYSALTKQRVP